MNPNSLFLINLISTFYLVGLIWTIQVVHYNLFDRVGPNQFVKYEADHCRLITPVVGPIMLVEIATAAMLIAYCPAGISRQAMIVGFVAVVLIWLSTAFIQVPYHHRLESGFNLRDYQGLVRSNWIRTILWTGRGVLMTVLASRLLSQS